jgi:hypothetical protein
MSYETDAAAAKMVAEVERLYSLAVKSDPLGASAPWARYLRTGYYSDGGESGILERLFAVQSDALGASARYLRTEDGEVGIDDWSTFGLATAKAENGLAKWMRDGQAIVNACVNIITVNNYAADTKWDVYLNAFKSSVARDAAAVGNAAGDAADAATGLIGWLPWIVGGLGVVVGGIVIYEVAKTVRTAGGEVRATARTAGGAARRRFAGSRR